MGKKIRTQEASIPQASRIFTDREEPRKSFWKCYNHFKENMKDGDAKVLVYYGVGGIGKSSLLKQLIKEMDEAAAAKTISSSLQVYFDFNLKQEPRAVLEALRNKLVDDYKFEFPLFDIGSYVYAKKIGENRDRPEVKSFIERSVILRCAFAAVEDIPVVGIASLIARLADKGIAVFRNMKAKNRDELQKIEVMSHEELQDYFPVLFARDIAANMEGKNEPLVIFLDTYEQLVNEMAAIGAPLNNDLWLRDDNKGLVLNAPSVFWVIAGREKLKWPQDWGDSLEQHILGNLSETDAKNFLLHAGIEDVELQDGIYKLTKGTPVYLDLCVDRFQSLIGNGEAPRVENFGNDIYALIERFARYMDDARKDIVYILSCLGVWSDEMALEIGPKVLPNYSVTTYEKVKGLSFIIESEKGRYNLHQTVGDVLYKDCPESIKEKTVSAAIAYCEEKLSGLDAFSTEFEYYVGWLMKHALRYYCEDDDIRGFYIEHIRPHLNKLNDLKRFRSIEDLFNPFWERASQDKESRLYALVQKDYSIWLRGMGRYKESTDMAKSAYELYVKLIGADDVITLRAQREYAMGLHSQGMYQEALEIRKEVLERRIKKLGEKNLETVESFVDMANSYEKLGMYGKQLEMAEKAYQLRSILLDPNDPFIFRSRNNLVTGYRNLGENKKAYEIGEVLLADVEKKLGKDDECTLDIMSNHIDTLVKLGLYDKAVALRKEVLDRRKMLLGEDHPKTIRAIRSLSSVYDDMGRYADALPLRELVLEKRRKLFGDSHPDTLKAIWGVAYALEQLGRYQEALALRQKIYDLYKETQGEDFPDTITALGNIAKNYEKLGEYDKAVALRKEVLERRKKLLGEDHPKTISAIKSLSSTYDKMGRYSDMLPLKELILEKRRKLLGDNHPDSLKAIWGVAYALEQLGRYQEALVRRQEIYDLYKETQGKDFPDTITALGNIAKNYENLGEYDKAVELRKEVLERRKALLGEDHPKTISAVTSLSSVYDDMGRYADALPLRELVLEKRRKLLGDNHPDTLDAIWGVAYALEQLGRYQEALVRRQEIYDLYKETQGENFPDTMTSLGNIAIDYEKLGQYDKAVNLRREALERRKKLFGDDHPKTIVAKKSLAGLYARCAMYDEAEVLYKDNLERQERLTGKESLKTISALNSLAWFYFLKNEPEKGVPYAEKALDLISKNPNVSNRTRIDDADTLILLYASMGRLKEAYEMAQQLLNDALKEYASDQKFIANRHYALAYVLNKMNRLDEALGYAQKSYDVRMRYLGEFDEKTKRTEKLLNEIKSK
ncbi:Tetratricopeptide repeat-containing protein [Fibrobacter sp. UWT2]|uniref:tetratricopeptide repeat protein n=1 Tax=Fibrobacter sp. UWT2 TaxID=1896224 RepID=UPI00091A1148|nr:tetratricopeptide repeat protein [Fibrobacter sp. UWT2]SHL65719.1 Tetratricopeptide repeat-containing protein [Fibrobacter sp. UWT2]